MLGEYLVYVPNSRIFFSRHLGQSCHGACALRRDNGASVATHRYHGDTGSSAEYGDDAEIRRGKCDSLNGCSELKVKVQRSPHHRHLPFHDIEYMDASCQRETKCEGEKVK